MSKIKVNSLEGVLASTPAISIDNTSGTASANLTSVSGGQFGNRNMVHNGEFVISQRIFSSAVTQTGEAFTLDRWKTRMNVNSKFSVQQVADAPEGFYNSAKITSLAATSVGADDYYQFQHCIEGFNLNPANFGTTTAKALVFSFYVKSSLTGTFSVGFSNNAGDRYFVQNYTISSADTWERKTISIPAITTGSWNRGNTEGLFIYFTLGAGSNTLKSTGSWGTSFGRGGTGGANIVATNAATWQVTGVQLEINDTGVATEFEHRPVGQELALCQRYYELIVERDEGSNAKENCIGLFWCDGSSFFPWVKFHVKKRSQPTLEVSDFTNAFRAYGTGGGVNVSTLGTNTLHRDGMLLEKSGNPGSVGFVRTFVDGSDGLKAIVAASAEI
tara:strand:+ start:42 stop:1205 length:1164 start_codon:yes stop_codon:yes gene_type:complete